ncbi:MAG: hypothetical protein M1401_14260 [Chloroflexi bacterium]|nr:hypothetical protein [Chloroflexota bacterium]
MNNHAENDITIVAALLVLLAAMCDPRVGVALAGIFLGAAAVLRFTFGR